MLRRFAVENFKNFEHRVEWDLSHPCSYEFHTEVIRDHCVTKGIIYGPNGSGKSNLGLALFDLIFQLTDKEKLAMNYINYLNLNGSKPYAEFEYEFLFDGIKVLYQYRKKDVNTLQDEHLWIGDREVVFYDFEKETGFVKLAGAEQLNLSANGIPISRVKYIRNNTILMENEENQAYLSFMNFVDHMLMFYSLDTRGYQGFSLGGESISQAIIESGHLEQFEEFLRTRGLEYKLMEVEVDGGKELYCAFDKGKANFFSVASTGTRSLALLYYWYVKMEEASLVYIDEFDAFYHFELAEDIVSMLKKTNSQVFLSTHNTDLMSNDLLRPDCYFLIDHEKIKSICELTEKELRKAHNLQKMYKAGAFHE